MTDVFISYSRKNDPFVRRLFDALETGGRNIWIDWQDIPPTADWLAEIYNAIEETNTFVFVISPDSLTSPMCNLEVDYALKLNKRLVPLVYRTADPQKVFSHIPTIVLDDLTLNALARRDLLSVARENWQNLQRHQWLMFENEAEFDANFQKLITALDTDLDYVRDHTRLLTRAKEWDKHQRNDSFLLKGAELQKAEAWLRDGGEREPKPNALHTDYILASRRAATLRQSYLLGATTFALVITLLLALLAFVQSRNSQQEANRRATQELIALNNAATAAFAEGQALDSAATSDANASIAATSEAVAVRNAEEASSLYQGVSAIRVWNDDQRELALLLALEAGSIPDPPFEVQRILANLAYQPGVRMRLNGRVATYSPNGEMILAGVCREYGLNGFCIESGVDLLDSATGELIRRFEGGHSAWIWDVAFSLDGQKAFSTSCVIEEATQCIGGEVILWDVQSGQPLHTLHAHLNEINGAAFSPNSEWLLSGGCGQENEDGCTRGEVVLWDVESGQEVRRFAGHAGLVVDVAFSPDGQKFVSGGNDGVALVWNVASRQPILEYNGHTAVNSSIRTVAFSPDGQQILSGSWDGSLHLWDAETGETTIPFEGHTFAAVSAVFSPDGQTILSGGGDSSLRLWNAQTGLPVRVDKNVGWASSLSIAPDGNTALVGLSDQILIWDINNGAEIFRFRHERDVLSAALSPDGKRILASIGRTVTLWDTTTGEFLYQREVNDLIWSVAFSPDGRTALLGSSESRLILWNVDSGQEIQVFQGHNYDIWTAVFSPDGRTILSGAGDYDTPGEVILWDTATGQAIYLLTDYASKVNTVAFSPNGHLMASGGDDSHIFIRDAITGEVIHDLSGHEGQIESLVFSPDGQWLLSGSGDKTLILWDVDTGKIIRRMVGHAASVNSVAFSPDGKLILSGAADFSPTRADNSIRLWDAETGEEIRRFDEHTAMVMTVGFGPDGQTAFSASADGTIILWRIDTLEQLVEWTRQNRIFAELTCEIRDQFRIQPLCGE